MIFLNKYIQNSFKIEKINNFILKVLKNKIINNFMMCFLYSFALNHIYFTTFRMLRLLKINFTFLKTLSFFKREKLNKINNFSFLSGNPERMIFTAFITLNLIMMLPNLGLTKMTRYNMILVISLLMLHSLFLCWCDFFSNFLKLDKQIKIKNLEFETSIEFLKEKKLKSIGKKLIMYLILIGGITFMILFLYLFFMSLQNKYRNIKGIDWLTSSARFWVKLKTSTLKSSFNKN